MNSKKLETPLERSILPLARSQHGGSIVDKAVDLQGRPIAIEDDELIEVTPSSIRLRKRALGATERRKLARNARAAEES